ncbi:response regulator [Thermodesulfobacteriota bacterium]
MAKNIMFVDDEAGILKSLKWVFANEPYCYLGFDNPEAALAKMEETEIAVVVADQRMPKMEGIQFLERVKERWPDTIRIIMTAYLDFNVMVNAVNKANVYRVILKPWDETEIKMTINNAMAEYASKAGSFTKPEFLRE